MWVSWLFLYASTLIFTNGADRYGCWQLVCSGKKSFCYHTLSQFRLRFFPFIDLHMILSRFGERFKVSSCNLYALHEKVWGSQPRVANVLLFFAK
jgi:hypothetical protein